MNALTAPWAGAVDGGTVFSAAGVWPLPALLADGAGGAARAEPADAVGVPAGQSAAVARELVGGLAAAARDRDRSPRRAGGDHRGGAADDSLPVRDLVIG
ncbi:hypothetical protein [Streptomyces sp. NPDC101455]|uniref:hypothetical protein n=1 Tax=Streptomyces sp. NPDC101455 TaxID=3366142 RepID=UPI003825BD68